MLKKTKRKSQIIAGYIFIIIPILTVFGLMVVPFAVSVYYSMTDFKGFGTPNFIGLKNYFNLFSSTRFYSSIKNNFIIASASPLWIFIPLLIALVLFQYEGKLLKTSRMLIFLPYAISMTIVGIIFRAFLQYTGPINSLFEMIGANFLIIDWLNKAETALPIVIAAAFWKDFGIYTVMYLAGLSNLDQEILDAAKIDGVNWFQQLTYIIIPSLNPIIVFVTALVLIGDFRNMFDYIYNITRGGPGYGTHTIEFLLYREGFNFWNMGYACAIGTIIFVLIFIIASFQIKIMTRND